MLTFESFYSSKNPEKVLLSCFKHRYNKKKVSSTANHNIRMISEGSCDTKDWSNDAEKLALITGINYILKYIQIESSYFK